MYPCRVRRKDDSGRFAERVLRGVDDAGGEERTVIWIERRPRALWAVGRAVNPQHRPSETPRPDDYVFEGYELEDALEAANVALEDDVVVLDRESERVEVEADDNGDDKDHDNGDSKDNDKDNNKDKDKDNNKDHGH